MNRDLTRQLAVVLTFVLTLIFNGMATTGALGGTPTADISNAYPIAFVPANVTFSIWGVIYTGLLLFVIYQALPAQRENPILRRIGWLFVFSGVANALWLVLFQYELFVASVPVMLILLVTLIAIYQQTGIRESVVSRGTRWLVQIPFSIYLGWITVAT
ncbi:MAG: tryptophan-rich sensory protein, partial [Anaerolineae bacterium]|nr:tryptophan-rich sensory protein [Anaerolineae bacterium]